MQPANVCPLRSRFYCVTSRNLREEHAIAHMRAQSQITLFQLQLPGHLQINRRRATWTLAQNLVRCGVLHVDPATGS